MIRQETEGEPGLRWLLAPIADDLDHPDTTEVVVRRPGRVGVEQGGHWHWRDVPELTRDRLEGIAILAAGITGKEISTERDSCVSILPDGQRIKMLVPPAVEAGTVGLCIRKRAASFTPTLEWLAETSYFELLPPRDWPAYFRQLVRHKPDGTPPRPILISGEPGSSKTTFGEALVRDIPLALRVVTVEGSPEWLDLPHDGWHPLYFDEARPETAIQRVQDAMQLRPDWTPFQEIRGSEAWSLMRAAKAGFRWITTIHAPSGRDALSAAASMIRQSGHADNEADVIADLRRYIGTIVHVVRIMPSHPGETTRYRAVEVIEVGRTEAEDVICRK